MFPACKKIHSHIIMNTDKTMYNVNAKTKTILHVYEITLKEASIKIRVYTEERQNVAGYSP